MAVQGGPEYPGLSEGLVFCFDPKNPVCCPGSTPLSSSISGWGLTPTNFTGGEYANVGTDEGYMQLDGTDDFIKGTKWQTIINRTRLATEPYTISTWCKSDTTGEDRYWVFGALSTSWGEGTALIRLEDTATGGPNTAVFSIDDWATNMCSGSCTFTDWNNIVGTCDTSRNMEIYINGVAGSTLSAGQVTDGDMYLSIGASTIAQRPFDGAIGPCMIYNRVLSASEVLKNYNALKERFGL